MIRASKLDPNIKPLSAGTIRNKLITFDLLPATNNWHTRPRASRAIGASFSRKILHFLNWHDSPLTSCQRSVLRYARQCRRSANVTK